MFGTLRKCSGVTSSRPAWYASGAQPAVENAHSPEIPAKPRDPHIADPDRPSVNILAGAPQKGPDRPSRCQVNTLVRSPASVGANSPATVALSGWTCPPSPCPPSPCRRRRAAADRPAGGECAVDRVGRARLGLVTCPPHRCPNLVEQARSSRAAPLAGWGEQPVAGAPAIARLVPRPAGRGRRRAHRLRPSGIQRVGQRASGECAAPRTSPPRRRWAGLLKRAEELLQGKRSTRIAGHLDIPFCSPGSGRGAASSLAARTRRRARSATAGAPVQPAVLRSIPPQSPIAMVSVLLSVAGCHRCTARRHPQKMPVGSRSTSSSSSSMGRRAGRSRY
jgi:hypothetical protein